MSNVACPHPRNLHAVWPTRCLDCARAQLSKKTHLTHVVHNEGRYTQHTQSGTSPVSRLQRYRTLVNDLNLISRRGWPIGTYAKSDTPPENAHPGRTIVVRSARSFHLLRSSKIPHTVHRKNTKQSRRRDCRECW